jgi:hypothetical protein
MFNYERLTAFLQIDLVKLFVHPFSFLSLGQQSSFSGDSSYSFEVGGGCNLQLLDEIEVEYEDILMSLTATAAAERAHMKEEEDR